MLDIFKRTGAEPGQTKSTQAAQAVERLEESRTRAQHVHDVAQTAYEQAALDATEGNESALDDARRNVERSERYLVEADMALQGARKRLQAAQVADAKAAHAAAWDRASEAATRRNKAIAHFDSLAEKMGDAYRAVIEATNDMATAMPANRRPDLVGALLAGEHVVPLLRLRLRKAGLPWAHNWPDGVEMIPDVAQQLRDETRAVAALRPEEN